MLEDETKDFERRDAHDEDFVWFLDDEQQTIKPKRYYREGYEKYIREIAEKQSRQSLAEEIETIVAARNNNIVAKLSLILHSTKAIVKLIELYGGAKAKTDFAELYHESLDGLEKALEKFDSTRGVRFMTYAKRWVVHAISKYTHEEIYRYPKRTEDNIRDVLSTMKKLTQELGREPSIDEIAQVVKLSPKAIVRLLSLMKTQHCDSLDLCMNEAIDIPDPKFVELQAEADDEACLVAVQQAMKLLKERHQRIVEMHLGLANQPAKNFIEIGRTFSVSERRARAIYSYSLQQVVREVSQTLGEPEIAKAYFHRLEKRSAHEEPASQAPELPLPPVMVPSSETHLQY